MWSRISYIRRSEDTLVLTNASAFEILENIVLFFALRAHEDKSVLAPLFRQFLQRSAQYFLDVCLYTLAANLLYGFFRGIPLIAQIDKGRKGIVKRIASARDRGRRAWFSRGRRHRELTDLVAKLDHQPFGCFSPNTRDRGQFWKVVLSD